MEHKKKILFVDDDNDIVEIMSSCLEIWGYRVFTAPSGTAAWEIILNDRPDLVVTDIQMPKGNGYELMIRAKKNKTNIPFIVVTAFAKYTDEELLEAGAWAVFHKPKNLKELKNVIEDVLHAFQQGPSKKNS